MRISISSTDEVEHDVAETVENHSYRYITLSVTWISIRRTDHAATTRPLTWMSYNDFGKRMNSNLKIDPIESTDVESLALTAQVFWWWMSSSCSRPASVTFGASSCPALTWYLAAIRRSVNVDKFSYPSPTTMEKSLVLIETSFKISIIHSK